MAEARLAETRARTKGADILDAPLLARLRTRACMEGAAPLRAGSMRAWLEGAATPTIRACVEEVGAIEAPLRAGLMRACMEGTATPMRVSVEKVGAIEAPSRAGSMRACMQGAATIGAPPTRMRARMVAAGLARAP